MNKVYFSKNFEKILGRIDLDALGRKVAIKVHFGEQGCNTYIDPGLVRKIYDKVAASGRSAALVECNVLYKGSRTNASDHIKTAREHGFNLPIDILDGPNGGEYIELGSCKVGKGLEKYDSILVVSHFKGHMGAGFGGAIKNLGMGLGSRAGKLDMHSSTKPVIADKCIACGICIENCNAAAITITGGQAVIDQERCEGCAMCIAVCPNGAAQVPWQGRTNEELQKRIAEYAKAIVDRFPKILFINMLVNITEHCDCMGMKQAPIMQDVGFLYSDNILAIDQACLELADKYSDGKFSAVNKVDNPRQLKLAEAAGLGRYGYELIKD